MNHVKFRERTQQDNINSVLNLKTKFIKDNDVTVVPEPLKEPIVYWSRKKYKIDKKYIDKEIDKDKLILECLKWPLKTDILCFNCCHSFDGVPVPLPTIYDKKRKIYFCHGNFCSWQCSKAYNINEMPTAGQGNRNMNISLLSRQMWSNYKSEKSTGNTVYSIPIDPAPRRSELKVFGGTKTIEEYRRGFYGIVPPEEAFECKPFMTIKNRLALPFIDKNATIEFSQTTLQGNDNSSFAFSTTQIETSAIHQHANKFCERLNKAKNEKVLIKRERKEDNSKNTLLSSMGVVVKKKR